MIPTLAAAETLTLAPGTKIITNGQQFWELSSAEKELPHQLSYEITVYYYDPFWNLLWGECNGAPGYLPVQGGAFPLRAGQKVRLEGVIVPGKGILRDQIKVVELADNAMPKAVQTRGLLPAFFPNDSKWVEMEGYVFRQQLTDPNHVEYQMLTEDWLANVRLLIDEKDPIPQLTNARVRFTGLLAKEANKPARTVDLWVSRAVDVAVLGELSDEPRFKLPRTALEELATSPADDWVRVEGEVREFVPGDHLTLRDGSGQLRLSTLQPGDLQSGATVEVIGRVSGQGLEVTLSEPIFRLLQRQRTPEGPRPGRRTIRIVEQILELSPMEVQAGQEVLLQGLVTWSDPQEDRFYIQDGSGGICIRRPPAFDAPRLHDWIVVQGRTQLGDYAPEVSLRSWNTRTVLAEPPPPLMSLEEALTGASEARRIALRGYLRQVVSDGKWTRLDLTTGGGEFAAYLPRDESLGELTGAMVRVAGVCTAEANKRRQLVGIKLWVPERNALLVETPPPADAFALPRYSISGLNQFTRAGILNRRVVVSGEVLSHVPGRYYVLQDGEAGLLVYTRADTHWPIGSQVEASGLPGREGNRLVLREAVTRPVAEAREALRPLVSEKLLQPSLEWDARLVSLRGVLNGVVEQPHQHRLTIQTGSLQFDALLPAGEPWPVPEIGSFLKLTGVYLLEFDESRQPRGFRLELRHPGDIEVVDRPAWLTLGRAMAIATSLAGLIIIAMVWVTILRRRIQEQTAQIRRQMEREARMQAELERATRLDSLGVLAGGIAHDFNNLLTAIRGNLGLIQLEQAAMASIGHLVNDAERAAKRATDVTQQLLTFAKGGDPVRTILDLTDIVREAATFARHGSNVRVEFFFSTDLPPAEVDAGQISRVVHNLVLNAVQCLHGGGEVRVGLAARDLVDREVTALPAGRYLLMTVADNGPGIPADRLPRIFDPYYTTKVRGSGLGLATCHSIVKKHQGHIEVASSPQIGTIFHVWLPAAKNPHAQIRIDTSSPIAPDGAHVLFMDDDEGVLKLARAYLERTGHDGVLVSDGKDAVAVYRQAMQAGKKFDVVIFDLTVPGGMGGKEALEQLKALDPAVRVIASSGYSNDPVMANHQAFGFSAVLPKPYDLESFRRVIARVRAGKN